MGAHSCRDWNHFCLYNNKFVSFVRFVCQYWGAVEFWPGHEFADGCPVVLSEDKVVVQEQESYDVKLKSMNPIVLVQSPTTFFAQNPSFQIIGSIVQLDNIPLSSPTITGPSKQENI